MAKKVSFLGLLTCLAILIGYVETLIPLSLLIPGIKLGLCNIVIVYVLYIYSVKEAFIVSVIRVLVIGFLFGNFMSIAFSLGGTVLSIISMALIKKSNAFSICGTSILGGTMHNIGQLMVSLMIIPLRAVISYMPVLTAVGAVTGLITGMITIIIYNRVSKLEPGRL